MINESAFAKTGLILIDIQDFYFPGGTLVLENPQAAAEKAGALLTYFRKQNWPVVHIMHKGGGQIRPEVAPTEAERTIEKSEINSFKGTDLEAFLRSFGLQQLVLAGMQTNMCLEAATRAASDLGFKCTVIHDACAARNLKFLDHTIKASDVHATALVSLQNYAHVISLKEYLALASEGPLN